MIIRAVSSSDDDSDSAATHAAPSLLLSGADANASSLSASSAVKLAWLSASLALVALLLLDLAALLNQFFPGTTTDDAPRAFSDPFTVVSWILLLWRRQGTSLQPATVLNNLLGQLFVGAWIYSRETVMAAQRQRASSTSRRHQGAKTAQLPACILRALPWGLVAAVLCLGHLASCGYILFALFESHGAGGSVRIKFWLGRSSVGSRTAPRV